MREQVARALQRLRGAPLERQALEILRRGYRLLDADGGEGAVEMFMEMAYVALREPQGANVLGWCASRAEDGPPLISITGHGATLTRSLAEWSAILDTTFARLLDAGALPETAALAHPAVDPDSYDVLCESCGLGFVAPRTHATCSCGGRARLRTWVETDRQAIEGDPAERVPAEPSQDILRAALARVIGQDLPPRLRVTAADPAYASNPDLVSRLGDGYLAWEYSGVDLQSEWGERDDFAIFARHVREIVVRRATWEQALRDVSRRDVVEWRNVRVDEEGRLLAERADGSRTDVLMGGPALDSGALTLVVGGREIEVSFARGDTPAVIVEHARAAIGQVAPTPAALCQSGRMGPCTRPADHEGPCLIDSRGPIQIIAQASIPATTGAGNPLGTRLYQTFRRNTDAIKEAMRNLAQQPATERQALPLREIAEHLLRCDFKGCTVDVKVNTCDEQVMLSTTIKGSRATRLHTELTARFRDSDEVIIKGFDAKKDTITLTLYVHSDEMDRLTRCITTGLWAEPEPARVLDIDPDTDEDREARQALIERNQAAVHKSPERVRPPTREPVPVAAPDRWALLEIDPDQPVTVAEADVMPRPYQPPSLRTRYVVESPMVEVALVKSPPIVVERPALWPVFTNEGIVVVPSSLVRVGEN